MSHAAISGVGRMHSNGWVKPDSRVTAAGRAPNASGSVYIPA